MLGHKLAQVWQNRFDVRVTLRTEFSQFKEYDFFNFNQTFELVDVRNFEKIEEIIKGLKPDTVINAVGIIKQKPTSKDIISTLEINSIFPQKLARIAKRLDFRLITISTDCVFDGKKGFYTEKDIPNAADLYGKSKNLGEVAEENCLTLRTSIIGREIETSHSLIEWFISERGGKVKGFKNAIYTGFPTVILAGIIGDLIEKSPSLQGLYHLSSEPISKFNLLNLINEALELGITVEAAEDFVCDRSLDSTKFRRETGFQPKDWQEMIKTFAADAKQYESWRNKARKK